MFGWGRRERRGGVAKVLTVRCTRRCMRRACSSSPERCEDSGAPARLAEGSVNGTLLVRAYPSLYT